MTAPAALRSSDEPDGPADPDEVAGPAGPDGSADTPRPGHGPVVVRTRAELARARAELPGPVAVVMTMGALHAGHAELVRAARERSASVLVTIFLNPLQFGDGADLSAYPRTLDADVTLLGEHDVALVFAPEADEVYPGGTPSVTVSAGALGDVLEGAARPGHFDGVLTVVAKLIGLTRPDVLLFGRKDAQQLLLVERMAADLELGVEVVGVPTVRDDDGLALSSRNTHLRGGDRGVALTLVAALRAGTAAASGGAGPVRAAAREVLEAEPAVRVDYLALVDPVTLVDVGDDASGPALLAVAARVGTTRLIDNVTVELGG